MEDITLDETETVCKRNPKSRRSSILKQRTPLQVIEPNPRRVSFAFKQTKEFHSTEAPVVLGSSYEETFQSDSPKCTQESHFTMKMIHSTTTMETYSDRSSEGNMVSWHEEVFNTTQFVNIDNFGSSEGEYEARMSVDIQKTETQHCGKVAEKVAHKCEQGNADQSEQIENTENLTPEVLDHFMKQQKIQASKQILLQSRNNNLFDRETKRVVNISDECDTNNTKANVLKHYPSQTFTECSFPSSDVIRNEGVWNNELMPHVLHSRESKTFSVSTSPLNGNKFTEVTQLGGDIVCVNKDKLLMDADMDFTCVIHTNKASSGSDTSHVNNDMDLTKATFCRETNSNSGAQEYADLDESEIEITNTVGRIVTLESEDTSTKTSSINVLECDTGSISDSSNIQKDITKYTNKINAHLQNSNIVMQNTINLPTAVDSNKLHTMTAATSEAKTYILEKSDYSQIIQMESIDPEGCKSAERVFYDNQLELIGAITSNLPSEDIDGSQLEFTDVVICKPIKKIADNISSNIQINDEPAADSQLEFTNAVGFKIPVEVIGDSDQELTEVSGYKEVDMNLCEINLKSSNIKSCKQNSSEEDTICHSTHNVSKSITEDTNLKSVSEVSYHRQLESAKLLSCNPLTYTHNSMPILGSAEDSQLEFTDAAVCKPLEIGSMSFSKETFTNVNCMPTLESAEDSQLEFTNATACKLAELASISFSKETFTNVNMPTLESAEDGQLEFTAVAACKPAEIASLSFSKERQCDVNESEESQLELTGVKSSDSSLEFTNIVRRKSFVKFSDDSGLDLTNIAGQKQLAKDTDVSPLEVNDIKAQNLLAKDELQFTNFTTQKLLTEDSYGSQLQFSNNTGQQLPAENSDDSQLEFTNIVVQNLAAEDTNVSVSQLEFTNVIKKKPPTKYTDIKQLEITDISQKLHTKDVDDSQLAFTGQQLPEKDSDDSQMEFTKSTMQKSLAKDSVDGQLEFTDIVEHKIAAKHTDVSLLAFTDITGQKLPVTDTHINQLDFTNIKMQELPAKDFDSIDPEFINNTRQKLPLKDSVESELKFTNNMSNKSFAEGSDSQLEFTNITQKLPSEDSGDSQMTFSNITRQKSSADDSDDSQLQFTNITRDRLSEKYSEDSHLELTSITGHQTPTKCSDESHLEFTSVAGCIPPLKNVIDVELEFTACKSTANVLDVNNCNKEIEAIHLEYTLTNNSDLKIPNELKLKTTALNEKETEGKCDQTDSQVGLLSAIRLVPASEICDESCINIRETADSTNGPNLDEVVEINLNVSRKTSHKKRVSNEPINTYSTQLELTEVDPLKPTANVSCNLSCSKMKGENDWFSSRATDSSQLELTNVIGINAMAESCERKTVIIGTNSAKAVEEDKYIESTAVMDITNDIQCRKEPEAQLELTDIKSNQNYSASSYVERKENVGESIDVTELASNLRISRKRNANDDLHNDHSNDCLLESSRMKYFSSAKSANAELIIGAKIEISGTTSCTSFNEGHLALTATTEFEGFSPRHVDVIIPHCASDSQVDVTNTVSCETIKNISECISPASEVPSMNLHIHRYSDSMELTNKQNCVSQVSENLEFTGGIKYVNDVAEISLLQQNSQPLSHLKGLETNSLGQFKEISLSTNVQQSSTAVNTQQDECTHVIAVTDPKVTPKKREVVRNNPFRAHSSNSKKKHVPKRVQLANFLNITIGTDETFMLESSEAYSYPSPPKRIQLDADSQHASVKIIEEVKKNKKQSTELVQTNLHCEPEHTLLVEDELVMLVDAPSYNFDSEGNSCDSLMKSILDADRSLFGSKSTASPATELSSNSESSAVVNANEHLVKEVHPNVENPKEILHSSEPEVVNANEHLVKEVHPNLENPKEILHSSEPEVVNVNEHLVKEVHPNLENPKEILHSSEPEVVNANEYLVKEVHPNLENPKEILHSSETEIIAELERNFTDEQSPKIPSLKQLSGTSEIKTEMCHVLVDTDLFSVTGKDESAVEQADSNNREDIREKVVEIEVSGGAKKTVQLPNITVAHTDLNCKESIKKVTANDKTEQFKTAIAPNVGQSSAAVIQKPLSLEEWLRSGKHEWDVKKLSDAQWSFLFLYKSLGLVLKLDTGNIKDGMKHINDIHLESYLKKKSAPETHFVHHILLKKLSPQNLKTKFKVTADVPELMSIISKEVAKMKLFMRDFIFMETCMLMEMKDNRVSFKMSDLHIHSVFRITVDLSNWENIKPENVTVDNLMGTINKKEVQNLVNAVHKGPTFLSEYVSLVWEYISFLRKK